MCAIYVVILLSGLLVFWSAIFIDSKGRKFSRQEDSRILRKHHREIGKYLEGEGVPIIAKIPRAVALSRAAAAGVSVAEYDPKSHVVAPIELLADSVLNEEEKNNG